MNKIKHEKKLMFHIKVLCELCNNVLITEQEVYFVSDNIQMIQMYNVHVNTGVGNFINKCSIVQNEGEMTVKFQFFLSNFEQYSVDIDTLSDACD